MYDTSEMDLKQICCTCLSVNRKLFKLCKIKNGINNLYHLLSCDSEAYKEGFHKDLSSISVCWECRAWLRRISCFRQQACEAQVMLSNIVDGRIHTKSFSPLTNLCIEHKWNYDYTIISQTVNIDNFIDCSIIDNMSENDDLEDIPLSELKVQEFHSHLKEEIQKTQSENTKKKQDERKKIKKEEKMDFYKIIVMSEKEMYESREKNKMAANLADATFKCEPCIIRFKSQIDLDDHISEFHIKKQDHTKCVVCESYIEMTLIEEHSKSHYMCYNCVFCDFTAFNEYSILNHVKHGHSISDLLVKEEREPEAKLADTGKKRRTRSVKGIRTIFGFKCSECDQYFLDKKQKWRHTQREHKEGFRCHTCGKRFAFKTNLLRHERLHSTPLPRAECPTCHKQIRVDLLSIHQQIHTTRDKHSCAACDKVFVSRASYQHHLKYTSAHTAQPDILKYKCSVCDKGYRSRGELTDHENYQHRGETVHKCPVCGKALATRRCITRHVRRAHEGIKENKRDKICQQCGKAFRDKKGLREHEFIHTGERPLSCEVCGANFRQSASLYNHKRRIHKIHAPKLMPKLTSIDGT